MTSVKSPTAGPVPYLLLPGTARQALTFYQQVFGGQLQLANFEQFQRSDGAPDLIAHGELSEGPVRLFAADSVGGEDTLKMRGLHFALLGVADAAEMATWFEALAAEGTVIDPLVMRPWGDTDGQVRDRFGVRWLLGFQH